MANGGDPNKLKIIQEQINALTEARQQAYSALDEAQANSARRTTDALVTEYERRRGLAGDNLSELLTLETEFGPQIADAKARQRKADFVDEQNEINDRYDKLVELNKNNADVIAALNKQRGVDLADAERRLTYDLIKIEVDRNDAYQRAYEAREAALKNQSASTQREIRQASLKTLSEEVANLETERDALLESDKLTAADRLKIQEEYAEKLKAAKIKENQEAAAIEVLGETERYEAARQESLSQGILTAARELELREQYLQNLRVIELKYKNEFAQYSSKIDKQVELAREAAVKEATQAIIDASANEIDERLKDLERLNGAQRDSAIQALKAWAIATTGIASFTDALKALPKVVAENLEKAIAKIEALGRAATATFKEAADAMSFSDLQAQADAVGKPQTSEQVATDAAKPFDDLARKAEDRAAELKRQFEDLPVEEQKAQRANYDKLIASAVTFAAAMRALGLKAGQAASKAFVQGLKDDAG